MNWYCLDFRSRELYVYVLSLMREVAHLIAVHRGAKSFLERAKHDRKRVVLITNAHPASLELKMRKTELGCCFDQVGCAHSLGAPKEDARFKRALSCFSPFEPESTVFVDDGLPVLRAARDFGLRHVVAVARLDSGAPSKSIEEFVCIDRVDEISRKAALKGGNPGVRTRGRK